jgi:hypothetical protein
MDDRTAVQIRGAYRRMASEVGYHPAAPSDGFGHIVGDIDVPAQAEEYAAAWWAEEDLGRYAIGMPDWADRAALIWAVEAARLICGMDSVRAARLLRMAADDLEGRERAAT